MFLTRSEYGVQSLWLAVERITQVASQTAESTHSLPKGVSSKVRISRFQQLLSMLMLLPVEYAIEAIKVSAGTADLLRSETDWPYS